MAPSKPVPRKLVGRPSREPVTQIVSIRLTFDVINRVDEIAESKNIGRTAAVEGLLRRYLGMPLHPFDTKEDRKNERRFKD